MQCRVVSIEGNLSTLGTRVQNRYTVIFRAKKKKKPDNQQHFFHEAANCSLFGLHIKHQYLSPFLQIVNQYGHGASSNLLKHRLYLLPVWLSKTWDLLWYIPSTEKPLSIPQMQIISGEKSNRKERFWKRLK